MEQPLVLFVEDNKSDVLLVQEALRLNQLQVQLKVLEDGDKAIRWIEESERTGARKPAAVILDLNLPKRHGAEVLSRIRSSEWMSDTPVLIFTSSSSARDRSLVDQFPRTRYFRKASDVDEFMGVGVELKQLLAEGRNGNGKQQSAQ